MKLTAGYGREVCGVLEGIAEYVLEKKNFTFKAPVYLPENYAAAGEAEEDDMDMGVEQDEFQLPDYVEEENEEEAYMASQVRMAIPLYIHLISDSPCDARV